MPSTNKTAHLGLNQWIGSDKPRKDDFNADNAAIDQAIRTHVQDATAHVTSQERQAWNQVGYKLYTYAGDNSESRTITLDFAPTFGLLFPVGKPIGGYESGPMQNYQRTGFFSPKGCSVGLSLAEKALTVKNLVEGVPTGFTNRYNETGVTYVIAAFK